MDKLTELRHQDKQWKERLVEKEMEDRDWERRMDDGTELLHPYERDDKEHRAEMQRIRLGKESCE